MLADGTFDGQVAVVTGGGSGMGRAMAVEFSRLGAAVVVAGRRAEPLAETVALIEGGGGTALAEPTDVRDPEQVDALMRAAVDTFGRIDCLVNNAAGNFVVKAEDLSPNGWRAVTSIVLDGSFLCARAAGKRMIESGEGGAIVSVIASYAWTGGPGDGALGGRQGGRAGDDPHAGGRVGAARHPGEHDLPRPDRDRGCRRRALADARGRGAGGVVRPDRPPGARRGDRLVDDGAVRAEAAYITGANLTIDGGHWLEQEGYMGALGR